MKTFKLDDIQYSELNTAQVEYVINGGKLSEPDYMALMWQTIAMSVNNVTTKPTGDDPLNLTDAAVATAKAEIGFVTARELYAAILEVSGLKPVSSGEPLTVTA